VSTTNAIITDNFCVITQQRRTNNLYYLSFCNSVIAWPQELTFGGAAGAASGDAAQAALSLERCDRLDFGRAACKAFCLVGEAFCIAFVVFWVAIQVAHTANLLALLRSRLRSSLSFSRSTRHSSFCCSWRSFKAA
jgi:hypothetical protein